MIKNQVKMATSKHKIEEWFWSVKTNNGGFVGKSWNIVKYQPRILTKWKQKILKKLTMSLSD